VLYWRRYFDVDLMARVRTALGKIDKAIKGRREKISLEAIVYKARD